MSRCFFFCFSVLSWVQSKSATLHARIGLRQVRYETSTTHQSAEANYVPPNTNGNSYAILHFTPASPAGDVEKFLLHLHNACTGLTRPTNKGAYQHWQLGREYVHDSKSQIERSTQWTLALEAYQCHGASKSNLFHLVLTTTFWNASYPTSQVNKLPKMTLLRPPPPAAWVWGGRGDQKQESTSGLVAESSVNRKSHCLCNVQGEWESVHLPIPPQLSAGPEALPGTTVDIFAPPKPSACPDKISDFCRVGIKMN